jgi:hypothetical protein
MLVLVVAKKMRAGERIASKEAFRLGLAIARAKAHSFLRLLRHG